MTNKEVIEDLKKSNEQLKARLKVEMMRMETAEIKETKYYIERNNLCIQALEQEQVRTQMSSADCISRQTQLENGDRAVSLNAVKDILKMANVEEFDIVAYRNIMQLPPVNPQEPNTGQYEKHIDHTDCIWYGSDGGCPVTCSQYRDGWNDAMDYIFKNGKGYQPYRRDG